jgi:hypothetical protein
MALAPAASTPTLVSTSTMPGSVAPSPLGVSGSTLSNHASSPATSASAAPEDPSCRLRLQLREELGDAGIVTASTGLSGGSCGSQVLVEREGELQGIQKPTHTGYPRPARA